MILLALLSVNSVKAIPSKAWNVAPPHWFVGFSNPVLEIIVNASEISAAQVFMKEYKGVEFVGKKSSANRHIAYLQIKITPEAKPGFLEFYSDVQPSWNRIRGARNFKLRYELKARSSKAVLPYKISDVLISDISSTIFEFLPLNRPIIQVECLKLRLRHRIFNKRFKRKLDLDRMQELDFVYKVESPSELHRCIVFSSDHPEEMSKLRKEAHDYYLFDNNGKSSIMLIEEIEKSLALNENCNL